MVPLHLPHPHCLSFPDILAMVFGLNLPLKAIEYPKFVLARKSQKIVQGKDRWGKK